MKNNNPINQQILACFREHLGPHGLTVVLSNGKKHAQIEIGAPGFFRKVAISHGGHKPIQHRLDWARQDANRVLREFKKEVE